MPPSDLERIIRRAQDGDREAVAWLYEQYARIIYRYIAYRVSESEAEDLVAEVFVKMLEALPRYRHTGAPFESWLYRIAAARVADHYRHQRVTYEIELSDTLSAHDDLPEESLLRSQEIDTLREALRQLNDEQQTVLILRFVEHKSHEQVAEIIGKGVNNVKSIQHRALTRLTTLLGSEQKLRHYLRGGHE